ncbi:DNA polymerase epsilon subunit [Plakobranchus ocellatus]|uniref:DNA polymerase epsilon subunit n=1 Tax=Plakobranchus ocellatus TaxID=259542 RepID=A0AAV3ZPQ9_9GAST|nr:DNA polymerase epsilon subunit [Plakobranchus ocellatus]
MHGLTLRSDASRYLVEVLTPFSQNERGKWLDKIIEVVQKQSLTSAMVGKDECEAAVQECKAEQQEETDSVFNVIDAFSVPRFTYVKDRKKFIQDKDLEKPKPRLHGVPGDKANMFRERYALLHQRTLRHPLFTPPILGSSDTDTTKFQLKPVEYLIGSTAKLGNVLVLGLVTENSFVLAEGWYDDGIFHVEAFGLPPPEKAETTRSYFGNINFFGGPSPIQVKTSSRLAKIEAENTEVMFVMLSDVWLDDSRVMEKLNTLFMGYSAFPPTAFILCGNFLSSPKVLSHARTLKECFQELGSMLSNYPDLINTSQFVFVPGPNDPVHSTILPRPTIPNSIIEPFKKKVPGAVFTSNPCRIQYCTQEIVIFREDIVTKMCRNCIRFPKEGNIPTHFSKSLMSQAHLCPLPLHVSPVYWAYDSSLRLYPLPDLIITADKYDPFVSTAMGTTIVNPGSNSVAFQKLATKLQAKGVHVQLEAGVLVLTPRGIVSFGGRAASMKIQKKKLMI